MQSALINTLEGEGYLEQQFVRLGNTYMTLFLNKKYFVVCIVPIDIFPVGNSDRFS